MEVFVSNQQSSLPISSESTRSVVLETLTLEGQQFDEVSIFFVSKEGIASLHAQYFNDPTPTDCISFPMDDRTETGYKVLGDIFVCPEIAKEFLINQKMPSSLKDVSQETTLYLVHGLLHLLGYDDLHESDRQKMRLAEKRIMDHLIQANLLLHYS